MQKYEIGCITKVIILHGKMAKVARWPTKLTPHSDQINPKSRLSPCTWSGVPRDGSRAASHDIVTIRREGVDGADGTLRAKLSDGSLNSEYRTKRRLSLGSSIHCGGRKSFAHPLQPGNEAKWVLFYQAWAGGGTAGSAGLVPAAGGAEEAAFLGAASTFFDGAKIA